MSSTAEASTANGFPLPGKKKKKKKKKSLDREACEQQAEVAPCSPLLSDHSSFVSTHVEDWDKEDSEVPRKKPKKKKKARKEISDFEVDSSRITTESELNGQTGTDACVHKKKKKKKRHSGNEGGWADSDFCVPETPDKTSCSPETGGLGHVVHGFERLDNGTCSPGIRKHNRTELSDTGDSQEELFASLPDTQLSNLSRKRKRKATTVETTELCSPVVQKKRHKRRKAPSVDDSNAGPEADETVDFVTENDPERLHGSSLQLSTSEGGNGLQKSPTLAHSDAEDSSASLFSLVDNEFVEFSKLAVNDLDAATQELEEFIPHIRSLSASAVKQLATRDLIRFKKFKKEGIPVKFGKFSKKENCQLQQNIEAFLEESGIDSVEKLLFTHRFPEEKNTINQLKAKHLFGVKIAAGIPRPWRLVYYRARKMFDPQNYGGKYSNAEKKKLKKYQATYGNNWKKISELMSRSSHSVAMKYAEIKAQSKFGPWSDDETRKLIQALEEMLRPKVRGLDSALEKRDKDQAWMLLRENLYKGISWVQVEAKVGTRHWRQCKQKWLSVLTQRMSGGRTRNRGIENLRVKISLIERLYQLDVEDTSEVDWEDLSSIIGNVPPHYVQSRFYRIKAMHVPRWNERSFPEIIDHLYEVTLPKLKQLLKAQLGRRALAGKPAKDQERPQKKEFHFSDIFRNDFVSDNDSSSDEDWEEKGPSDSEAED